MKKILNIIWNFIQIFIIIYVVLVTSFMFFSNKYGFTEIGKYVFENKNDGNLVIIKKSNSIKVGDSVYYYSTVLEKYVIEIGKVESINSNDNNKTYNVSNNLISDDKVIGKSSKKVPLLGKILNSLESRLGFLFFILLPILIVFIYQVYKFIVSILNEKIKK